MHRGALCCLLLVLLGGAAPGTAGPRYPWLAEDPAASSSLRERIPAPDGFTRVPLAQGSFGAFLRELPLLPAGTPVRSHAGKVVNAPAYAVVDLDVGRRDLMQCADSIIRLRAEHLFAAGRSADIAFHFTNGDLARFSRWANGWRPKLESKSRVSWHRRAAPDASHTALRGYLDAVFLWAGTASLATHTPVAAGEVQPGDFFVLGGFPGHALLVLDVARDDAGAIRLLLGQGFMPAQSFHVLRAADGGAWFRYQNDAIEVSSWPTSFPRSSLRRFPDQPARAVEQ